METAWDPLWGGPKFKITNRLKNYQEQLKRWNWKVLVNVNNVLKQKQGKLQLLKATECTHKNAEEIRKLKLEINETLTREEIMWNQRSRAFWIKWGDRNTKFFHVIASERRRRN